MTPLRTSRLIRSFTEEAAEPAALPSSATPRGSFSSSSANSLRSISSRLSNKVSPCSLRRLRSRVARTGLLRLPQLVEFSKNFGISAELKNITGSDFPQERRKDAVCAGFQCFGHGTEGWGYSQPVVT